MPLSRGVQIAVWVLVILSCGGPLVMDADADGDVDADADGDECQTPPTDPQLIPNASGFVNKCENEGLLQGYWYSFGDEYSEITPEPESTYKTDGDGTICTEGEAHEVVDDDYDNYYGCGIGLSLCMSDHTGTDELSMRK